MNPKVCARLHVCVPLQWIQGVCAYECVYVCVRLRAYMLVCLLAVALKVGGVGARVGVGAGGFGHRRLPPRQACAYAQV